MGILRGKSEMTIAIYHIDADGRRTDVVPSRIVEVYEDDPRPAPDDPCRCVRCVPATAAPR